ncbi:MAG: glycogen debranching enzyme GlgX, partial [Candidatus Saccharibacteria bacterium]|nr:glycogen debranching enzyme GlgX [Rhodoferax sp.]
LAQGIPQLLAGDELGHSQSGNNNAYCQDNAVTWLDWAHSDAALTHFVGGLIALRKRYPALRHPSWFNGLQPYEGGHPMRTSSDITWLKPEGMLLSDEAWQNPHELGLACMVVVGEGQRSATQRVLLVFNPADTPLRFELPKGPWRLVLNTATAEFDTAEMVSGQHPASRNSVMVLVQDIDVDLQESI